MDTVELGGNIQLTGFSELDGGQMIVLKKIVGNYARKFSDKSSSFQALSLTMKKVHERETSQMYEVNAKLMDNGQPIVSEITDRNLFVAVDTVLKKIESSMD